MTPPDSGDREVRCRHGYRTEVCPACNSVEIPLPLAQRILAALDVEADRPGGMYMRALASGLRAAAERKT